MNDKLASTVLTRDEDPQELFYVMDLCRTRLEQVDAIMSDYRYEDITV